MGLLTDIIREHVEHSHRQEDARKQQMRNFLHDSITARAANLEKTGQQSDPVLDDLTQQYTKLLNPEARKKAQTGFDLVGKIKRAFVGGPAAKEDQGNPQAQSAAPQQDQGSPPADGGLAYDPASPDEAAPEQPAQQVAQAPPRAQARRQFNAGPDTSQMFSGYGQVEDQTQAHNMRMAKTAFDAGVGRAQQAGLTNPRDIYAAGAGFKSLPTVIRPTTAVDRHAQLVRDYMAANNLDDTDEGRAEAERLASAEEVRQNEAKGVTNKQLRWFSYKGDKPGDPPHAVNVDAKHPEKMTDASNGQSVPEGSTEVNPAIIIAKIRQLSYGKMGEFTRAEMAKGYDEDTAKLNAANMVENDFQLRQSLVGAGRIREAMGQDAAGNSVAIPLQSTVQRRPVAPLSPVVSAPAGPPQPAQGGPGAPATGGGVPQNGSAQAAPQGAPPRLPPAGQTLPARAPQPQQAASPAAQQPVRIPANLAPRMLPGVNPTTARQAAQYSIPITESVVQLFSSPKALINYADLADDPKASQRIGKAVNLTRSSLGDGIADASVGGGAGGLHVSSGGFGTWLQNQMGVPGAIASQNADMLRKALSDLSPREREAYDATMSEFSVMAGLRSLSKSSAAVSNIKLIENEMAKLGTTASSDQFYDQMGRVGNAINNAVQTPGVFPKVRGPDGKQTPVGISPDLVKQLEELPARIETMKKQRKGPATAPTVRGQIKTADDYLKSIQAK